MGRLGPGKPQLVMAGETNDIAVRIEETATGSRDLQTVETQELDILGYITVTNMWVVTAHALHLTVLQGHRGFNPRATSTDMGGQDRVPQLAIGQGQIAIVGERDWMIITSV